MTLSDRADGIIVADAVLLVPDTAGAERLASWTGTAATAGDYRFYARWPAANDNASDARYTIAHAGGTSSVTKNQQANGGQWNLLGNYALAAGQAWRVDLSDQAHGNVVADAVYVVREDAAPETFAWTPTIPSAGDYAVYARWTASSANSPAAAYTIAHAGGTASVTVNQRQNGGQWRLLGTYGFAPGAGHGLSLAASADGRVVADAIRLVAASGPAADIVYIHPDQLGSPQKLTDALKAVVWDRQAGPFGELETISGLAAMPLRFPGQYADAETGFHYNYFRDYDPALGRYIESDPIGLLGGLNTYAYVGGNPVTQFDDLGLYTEVIIFEPVGWGKSSFGHTAVNINGTAYSYAAGGMTIEPTTAYMARNTFRDAEALILNLRPWQELLFEHCLKGPQGEYDWYANSCTDPIERCLRNAGYDIGDSLTPSGMTDEILAKEDLLRSYNNYAASNPSTWWKQSPWAWEKR